MWEELQSEKNWSFRNQEWELHFWRRRADHQDPRSNGKQVHELLENILCRFFEISQIVMISIVWI